MLDILFFFPKGLISLNIIMAADLILNKMFADFHKLELARIHFVLAVRSNYKLIFYPLRTIALSLDLLGSH
jgi:hypothetical protein